MIKEILSRIMILRAVIQLLLVVGFLSCTSSPNKDAQLNTTETDTKLVEDTLSFDELRSAVTERFDVMLKLRVLPSRNIETLKTIILNDIEIYSNSSQSKAQLIELTRYSLNQMNAVPLNAGDREFIVDVYYHLSLHAGIDIADILDEWLGGDGLAEIEKDRKNIK
ncbi:hypothetical protein [Dysgonomonas sp. ZJ279]|uniref:hypothetical protein n=1 Tax=Dysgonomonas sp. ZJ279 TaxID=2709796 RepID=UPI0013EB4F17|nr:hypothetical protein [Dysgonomonas sp. ZJ279]